MTNKVNKELKRQWKHKIHWFQNGLPYREWKPKRITDTEDKKIALNKSYFNWSDLIIFISITFVGFFVTMALLCGFIFIFSGYFT